MSNQIVNQTQVQIANTPVRGYKTSDGTWYLSIRSLGELLKVNPSVPFTFIKGKWLKQRLGKTYTPFKFSTEDNKEIVGITVEIAGLFIVYRTLKGDENALDLNIALNQQSLELRLESSLPETPVEIKRAVDVLKTKYEDVRTLREEHKEVHRSFDLWMQALRLSKAEFHNRLTTLLYGLSASELKEKYPEVFAGEEDNIGICHLQEGHYGELRKLIELKKYLSSKFGRKWKRFESYDDMIVYGMGELGYEINNI